MINDRAHVAAQDFLLGAKTFWTRRIYPALREEYDARVRAAGTPPETPEAVARLMAPSTLYQYFAWLERHLQRFKYNGRYGLHPWHAARREQLAARLSEGEGAVELQPRMEMPRYYASVDIHQHPGGVWSDPVAGYVYERGARTTTPLAGAKHRDLHDRLTAKALETAPRARRVLDMACGFGKSTRPFAQALPEAKIDAIDLAAPCLQWAAREAVAERTSNVRYRQLDARRTDYDDASFDLVTSTMFLHELPPVDIEAALAESARLLKPGGTMVHLDFLPQVQPKADPFLQFIHYGHGRRNNEPFMEPLARMDLAGLIRRLGFKNVRIEPFEESDGALAPGYSAWRFPWTLIVAERARVE